MKKIKPILIKHDVYEFQISKQAVYRGDALIGFYFDFLGFPQKILKNSVYGQIVFQKLGLTNENNNWRNIIQYIKININITTPAEATGKGGGGWF